MRNKPPSAAKPSARSSARPAGRPGPRPRSGGSARAALAPPLPHRAHAAIPPGLEDAVVAELGALGIDADKVDGGADFAVGDRELYAAHLRSRTAGRVTVEIGAARARDLDEIARGLKGLPWRAFVHPGQPVDVRVLTQRSRLHYPQTVAKKVENAITDALRGPRLPGPRPPREPAGVLVRVVEDRARVSIDASGDRLHRRGWRQATAKAPLRENLAAAILRLVGWDGDEPLVDPMCGSGTFAIEAAGVALGHAPGARRDFAFERWPCFDKKLWDALVAEAERERRDTLAIPIVAADRDAGAVAATRDNARRAGVAARVHVVHAPLAALEPPAEQGLVVMNPPWGERIAEGPSLEGIYREAGQVLRKRWPKWRVCVVSARPRLVAHMHLSLDEITTFKSGGVRVHVFATP